MPTDNTSPTTYRYTGQRQESSLGLYFYGARWYDPALGRFTSPDTIIPAQQGVIGNDRYAYVSNNPLIHTDPTGHYEEGDCTTTGGDCKVGDQQNPWITYDNENGLCIEGLGCSSYSDGWYQNWYLPRLPYFTHLHLTDISTFSQDVAFGASSAGAGFEATGLMTGGPTGAVAGNALHQSTTNPIETFASGVSTGATLLDDIFVTPDSGSYISDAGVLVVSDATATSVVATVVGGIIPIATVDTAIDGYVSRFNHGQAPGIFELLGINGMTLFGLIQFGE